MISIFDPPDDPNIRVLREEKGKERYRLEAPASYQWTKPGFPVQRLIALPGFIFDGASIPWAAQKIIGGRWSLGLFPPLFHDSIYRCGGDHFRSEWLRHEYLTDEGEWIPVVIYKWSRKDADRLFRRHMRDFDVPGWKREAAYWAVRLRGGGSWR